jgi:hypothetical protein
MDHWFHVNMAGTEIFSAWQSGLELLINKIDKKYFVTKLGKPTGLVQYRSPLYHLGGETVYHNTTCGFKNTGYLNRNEEVKVIKDKKAISEINDQIAYYTYYIERHVPFTRELLQNALKNHHYPSK